MTKREADRHLIAAYDHLLAAAPSVDGERHVRILSALGAIRLIRRDLNSKQTGARGTIRAQKP
jgi:hypothetical protein